ncbi:MAG TPA: hypothetical protein VFH18_08405 [Erysipelotrichaceae bacterium]|nr:hypothetical protein [Erysipelotrichaceae bacterium]
MNADQFEQVLNNYQNNENSLKGIGTLQEKILHVILKRAYQEDDHNHEIKLNGYVVDIFTENNVIEIQTRQFNKLRNKLIALLPEYPVTIVYPIPYIKYLSWIDPLTGESTKQRKSPKQGTLYDSVNELYKIKMFLTHPGLSIHIVFIDLLEYRLLNGWSDDKKKGSWRNDRIPLQYRHTIELHNQLDYQQFLPIELNETFTSKEFMKISKTSKRITQVTLNILQSVNVIEVIGKLGRLNLYQKI